MSSTESPETAINDDPSPVCFLITGAPRSGTTLLQNVVNSHPEAVCLHEFQFTTLDEIFQRIFRTERQREALLREIEATFANSGSGLEEDETGAADAMPSDGSFSPDSAHVALLEERIRFTEERIGTETLMFRKREHLTPLLKALFSIVSDKSVVRAFGDKEPNINSQAAVSHLRNIFPDLRIMYIIRNPMHVIRSSMRRAASTRIGQDNWPTMSLDEAIIEWRLNWEHAAHQFARNSQFDLFIRYEDLVADWAAVAARIADFLDLSPQFDDLVFPIPPEHWDYHLNSAEIATVRNCVGSLADRWLDLPLAEHLVASPRLLPNHAFGEIFNPSRQLNGPGLFRSGFGQVEPWGIWTVGHRAELAFRMSDPNAADEVWVTLTIRAFLAERGNAEFGIKVPGQPMRTVSIAAGQNQMETGFACPNRNGEVEIAFFIPRPKEPGDLPLGDHRALGLGIVAISVMAI